MKNSEEKKYRGLSVIVRNENDYKQLQKFLGQYLYIDWVPQMATTETSVIIYFDDENFMSIGSVGSAEYQKESNIRTIEFSEFFTTTQPQPTMSAEKQMIDFSWWLVKNIGRFSDDMQAHYNGEYLNIWRKSESLELNAIASFTPPRNEQEEADRLVELFADIDFEDSVLRSIQVVSYHRDNLKLRGLSTAFEEKVLTILKGM